MLMEAVEEDLDGYGHTKIGIIGTATYSVCYGSKVVPAFTFQVSVHGANLIDFDLFCANLLARHSLTLNAEKCIFATSSLWVFA